MKEAKIKLIAYENNIVYCHSEYEAAHSANALILITEWNQFRGLDLRKISQCMSENYFNFLYNKFTERTPAINLNEDAKMGPYANSVQNTYDST